MSEDNNRTDLCDLLTDREERWGNGEPVDGLYRVDGEPVVLERSEQAVEGYYFAPY